MNFDFTEKSEVKIKTYDHVESIINDFPVKISNSVTDLTPYGNNIFEKVTAKGWVKKLNYSILQY